MSTKFMPRNCATCPFGLNVLEERTIAIRLSFDRCNRVMGFFLNNALIDWIIDWLKTSFFHCEEATSMSDVTTSYRKLTKLLWVKLHLGKYRLLPCLHALHWSRNLLSKKSLQNGKRRGKELELLAAAYDGTAVRAVVLQSAHRRF